MYTDFLRFMADWLHDDAWLSHASEEFLWTVARELLGLEPDPVVHHYASPWRPEYFGRRDRLIHAIRAASVADAARAAEVATEGEEAFEWQELDGTFIARWKDQWRQDPTVPPLADRIRTGCDALRAWLSDLPPRDAARLLVAAAHAFPDEEYGMVLTDYFGLHHPLRDPVLAFPPNLPQRIAKARIGMLCWAGDLLRFLVGLEEPFFSRSDFLAVRDAAQRWLDATP